MNYGSLDCFMNGGDEINGFSGGDDGEWVETEAVMDSGSADCVARAEMFPQVEMEESPGSKAGQCWTTATKEEVPNEGQKTVPVVTEEGRNKKICWQIAPVHKPLMAVGKICDQENICVFGKRGGFIRSNETGELTTFWRKNGIYVMRMWMKKDLKKEGVKSTAKMKPELDFMGQGVWR